MTVSQTSASQGNTQQTAARYPSKRTFYLLFLLFLFIFYWVFVWQMERITLDPADFPLLILQRLPAWLVDFAGIFMPRVLRHFIPLVLGWLLAYEIAANLLYHLFDLPDRSTARGFLRRLRDPRRAGGATIAVSPQDLEARRTGSARLRVGGPGRVSVPTGHAAATELNGRFYRVIGSGNHALDRFEYLHSLYDLRSQDRTDPEVLLHSKEGLEFVTAVSATFRIDTPEMTPSAQQPYPYDAETIRKLAYNQTNLPNGQISNWENTALTVVKSALAASISSFSLNELLEDEQTEMGAHLTIRRNVERAARIKLRELGIELIRVRIGSFRFSEEVKDLHIEYWRTYWGNQARLTLAEGEVVALEEMELAQAEAEMELAKAIADGLEQARLQGTQGNVSEIVSSCFVETLEKMAMESEGEIDLPDQLLPQLHHLQHQLQSTSPGNSTTDEDNSDGSGQEFGLFD